MKKRILITAATLMVVAAVAVPNAMAYFTDSMSAAGRVPVVVGDSEIIPTENVEEMTKYISISNTGTFDVYIRAKAIAPSSVTLTLTDEAKANGWSQGDGGYYYYSDILPAGEDSQAKELIIEVSQPSNLGEFQTDFNVVIVQEAAKVHYKEDGTPYADWVEDVIITENNEEQPKETEDVIQDDNSQVPVIDENVNNDTQNNEEGEE